MKIPAGLLFLIVLFVLLAAALVGGQIWAMTGSIAWSCVAAVVSAGLLGLCVRFLIHRLATGGRRFFGEYQGPIEEGEFTDVAQVVSDSRARGKVRHGAQHRPERVAGSVRSLLTHSGRQKGTNR
jgi:membrane protein implicated in regulation of membrane protease activity